MVKLPLALCRPVGRIVSFFNNKTFNIFLKKKHAHFQFAFIELNITYACTSISKKMHRKNVKIKINFHIKSVWYLKHSRKWHFVCAWEDGIPVDNYRTCCHGPTIDFHVLGFSLRTLDDVVSWFYQGNACGIVHRPPSLAREWLIYRNYLCPEIITKYVIWNVFLEHKMFVKINHAFFHLQWFISNKTGFAITVFFPLYFHLMIKEWYMYAKVKFCSIFNPFKVNSTSLFL